MKESETLDISLLGKEYQVACPPRERESLIEAVAYLGQRFDETGKKAKTKTSTTNETLAVMTALNITHEFLQLLHGRGFDLPTLKRRIAHMQTRIEGVLAQQEKLF
jgi:cell division protein ZapA